METLAAQHQRSPSQIFIVPVLKLSQGYRKAIRRLSEGYQKAIRRLSKDSSWLDSCAATALRLRRDYAATTPRLRRDYAATTPRLRRDYAATTMLYGNQAFLVQQGRIQVLVSLNPSLV